MKRSVCMLLSVILCAALLWPVSANAALYYDLNGTDMSVFVDDTVWYVFTRDNIKDNPELEELGISYDQMHSILYDNYVYMDAFVIYENGGFVELFIRKKALDTEVVNLANYSNEQVLELAELLAEKQGAEVYSVYENQYKFVKLEYVDSNYGYYVCEFATII